MKEMNMSPKPGIEPGTFRSSVWRFTNWAISADLCLVLTLKSPFTENANPNKNWQLNFGTNS